MKHFDVEIISVMTEAALWTSLGKLVHCCRWICLLQIVVMTI